MKNHLSLLLCLPVLAAPACHTLTTEQKSAAIEELDNMLERGEITESQHEAAVEAVESDGASIDWEAIGYAGLSFVLMWLGIPISVRKGRQAVANYRRRRQIIRESN